MIPEKVKQNVPLGPLTTIQLGGPARYFFSAEDDASLESVLQWAESQNLPVSFLGGGSNVVFADAGWPGLVVHLNMHGIEVEEEGEGVTVRVRAGEPWDALVSRAVANDWAGIECLSGIPGSVGATPIQNVGAYGQEVANCILWVEVLERASLKPYRFEAHECGFGYRTSIFKEAALDQFLVTAVGFRFQKNGPAEIRYPDLKRRLSSQPSLKDVRSTVLEIRAEKAMVVSQREPNSKSCGSFFTNPIISLDAVKELQARGPWSIPSYSTGDQQVKIPAAWLIENAGFSKGFRWGHVGLSEKHTLALINRGQGTTQELLEFAQHLRETIFQTFGIVLWPEPVIWTAEGTRFNFPDLP